MIDRIRVDLQTCSHGAVGLKEQGRRAEAAGCPRRKWSAGESERSGEAADRGERDVEAAVVLGFDGEITAICGEYYIGSGDDHAGGGGDGGEKAAIARVRRGDCMRTHGKRGSGKAGLACPVDDPRAKDGGAFREGDRPCWKSAAGWSGAGE